MNIVDVFVCSVDWPGGACLAVAGAEESHAAARRVAAR